MSQKFLKIALALVLVSLALTASAFAFDAAELKSVIDEAVEPRLTSPFGDIITGGTLNKATGIITFNINPKSENLGFDEMVASISKTNALIFLFDAFEELAVGDKAPLKSMKITFPADSETPYVINFKGGRYSNLKGTYLSSMDVKCIIGTSLLGLVKLDENTTLGDFAGVSLAIKITGINRGDVEVSQTYTATFASATKKPAAAAKVPSIAQTVGIATFMPGLLLGI